MASLMHNFIYRSSLRERNQSFGKRKFSITPILAVRVEERGSTHNDHATKLEYIEQVTSKCDEIQKNVLAEILVQNGEVEYLKRHGISEGCMDPETYKANVPLMTYWDIRHDIQRVANGDFSPILCATPLSQFFRSSGTSEGKQKLIPTTTEDMKRRHKLYSLATPIISKYVEGLDKGKSLRFLFSRKGQETPGGLKILPLLTSYYLTQDFVDSLSQPYNIHTSPIEAIRCQDQFQSIYTQLLCGIYQRHDVVRIGATFASGLIEVTNFLKCHYSELCHDISTGKLSQKITDEVLRARVIDMCMRQPRIDLAEFIDEACRGGNWEGIIRKIWPNAKYLEGVFTGSAAQYGPLLEYYSGKLPMVSPRYASSECAFGINLNPMCDTDEAVYTLMPNMAYFEFLPLGSNGKNEGNDAHHQLVELANVEVGKVYELIITTYTGFYRYRVGDVLCPTGFYNTTPQFKFVRRQNVALNIDVENTTESELQKAVENASILLQPLDIFVVDYTSYVDVNTVPSHYIIYWELSTNVEDQTDGPGRDVIEQCCLAMEEALGFLYRRGRVLDNSIGPLEIRLVKRGTFEKLRDYAICNGASICQYKVPRCLNSMEMVDVMDSGVVSTYSSSSLPHWSL